MKLYLCHSIYQIIVALQIAETINKNEENLLMLSSKISASDSIYECLNGIEPSINVSVCHEPDNLKDWQMKFPFSIKFEKYIEKIFEQVVIAQNINSIDEFYFANIGGVGGCIAAYLKRHNPYVKVSMFEDGASSYSNIYGSYIMNRIKPTSIKGKLRDLFCSSVYHNVDYYYIFCPDLMVWNCPYQIKKIPALTENKERISTILNRTFGYDKIRDRYDRKVIFFEESYVEDGIPVADIEIVDSLAEKYGKENLMVKRHPRVKKNRFETSGYKTNVDFSIPWEVIAMNIPDLDDRILVTMTSTSLINTVLLFDSSVQIIFNYENMNMDNFRIKSTVEVVQKLLSLKQ